METGKIYYTSKNEEIEKGTLSAGSALIPQNGFSSDSRFPYASIGCCLGSPFQTCQRTWQRVHKAGAVKYPHGLIGSYSTISASVLVLQKALSTSVMGKSYNQLADLQASLTICTVVLIFGWLTNCAERFLAYFCWVSLTASLPENKWRGWPACQHFGIKAKAIFFWDPFYCPSEQ